MDIIYLILFFLLGASFGSFANVVIYRWPRDESIVSPRSRCPQCLSPIKSYHNIPMISWLILRGRCSDCKSKISVMYPLVEMLTGFIFALIFLTSGLSVLSLNMMIFTALAVPCFFIDLKHMYLPDIMTIPGLGFAIFISYFGSNPNFLESFLGAILGGGMLWLLAYAYKKWRGVDGLGGGDIKLLAWLGALLGFQSITFVLMTSSILGAIVGSYFLVFKGKDSKTFAIPFGPFLITAGYFYYFLNFSPALWSSH